MHNKKWKIKNQHCKFFTFNLKFKKGRGFRAFFCTFAKKQYMLNDKIRDLIPTIQEYMKTKPIIRAWLFGSFSRGEETSESDIDILVDYDESNGIVSLFKMGGMLMDLSTLMGRRVDLVDNSGLKEFARKSVDHDKILIYERKN